MYAHVYMYVCIIYVCMHVDMYMVNMWLCILVSICIISKVIGINKEKICLPNKEYVHYSLVLSFVMVPLMTLTVSCDANVSANVIIPEKSCYTSSQSS